MIGDIVERHTGPFRVCNEQGDPNGTFGFTSYQPVEGPKTKKQTEYCVSLALIEQRRLEREAKLRERVESCYAALPKNELGVPYHKVLIDLIVDLIHEESEG